MELKEYMIQSQRTVNPLENNDLDTQHALLGMITEVAEIADLYKKKMAYNKYFSKEQLTDELGDLMFYISAFCNAAKLDMPTVLEKNIQKLMVRYPDGFDSDRAISPNKVEVSTVFKT